MCLCTSYTKNVNFTQLFLLVYLQHTNVPVHELVLKVLVEVPPGSSKINLGLVKAMMGEQCHVIVTLHYNIYIIRP